MKRNLRRLLVVEDEELGSKRGSRCGFCRVAHQCRSVDQELRSLDVAAQKNTDVWLGLVGSVFVNHTKIIQENAVWVLGSVGGASLVFDQEASGRDSAQDCPGSKCGLRSVTKVSCRAADGSRENSCPDPSIAHEKDGAGCECICLRLNSNWHCRVSSVPPKD